VELAGGRHWNVVMKETYRPPADIGAPREGEWIVLSPGDRRTIVARVDEILPAVGDDAGTLIVERPSIQ
jgi:hypothetical protein